MHPRKILALAGSDRRDGFVHAGVSAVLEAAHRADAQTEKIYLLDLNIELWTHCRRGVSPSSPIQSRSLACSGTSGSRPSRRRPLPRGAPPQWEESFDQSPVHDPSQGKPDLGFELNQTVSW